MVSVIIINHNYGQYIGEAIESVLKQTYQKFELIIIDGASTDNSRQIITKYAIDYPEKIIAVFKPTSGQAAAFNLGYRLCKGDVLAFLDADDYYFENKLEIITQLHEKYDFVGHGRICHDKDGNLKQTNTVMDDYDDRPMLLKKYGYVYTYNLMTSFISMRKSLADKIFPMPEEGYVTFADCYVKVLAQYYSNIKFINDPLAYYRIHHDQKTQRFSNIKELEAFCQDLYNRVFLDINDELRCRGEKEIPIMDDVNKGEALRIANKHMMLEKGSKVVIYGTGAHGEKVFDNLQLMGVTCVFAIDSDENKWGKLWHDMVIYPLEEALEKKDEFEKIVLGTYDYAEEVGDILKQRGMKENKDYCSFISIPND